MIKGFKPKCYSRKGKIISPTGRKKEYAKDNDPHAMRCKVLMDSTSGFKRT